MSLCSVISACTALVVANCSNARASLETREWLAFICCMVFCFDAVPWAGRGAGQGKCQGEAPSLPLVIILLLPAPPPSPPLPPLPPLHPLPRRAPTFLANATPAPATCPCHLPLPPAPATCPCYLPLPPAPCSWYLPLPPAPGTCSWYLLLVLASAPGPLPPPYPFAACGLGQSGAVRW